MDRGRTARLSRRLEWVEWPDDTDEAGVLRQALAHTVGALDPWGSMGALAHLSGPGDALHQAAVCGVPMELAREWEALKESATVAPARAMALRDTVWASHWPGRSTPGGPAPAGLAGALSAPLTAADGTPIGALTVLLDAEPTPAAHQALRELAEAASARLPEARRWRSGATPWWQQTDAAAGRQMMREVSVGLWRWDLESDLLDVNETTEGLLPLAGIDPDRWGRTITEWMARIHQEDRPGVEAAIRRSLEDPAVPFAVLYRVVDHDGKVSWLELRASFERRDGVPVRMIGTAWDITARMSRDAWLIGILEGFPDPILILDAGGRTEWVNTAGSRLTERAGPSALTGLVPWEALPELRGQGLPELLARVRLAPGARDAVTVRVDQAGGDAWYRVRAVEVDGWSCLQWTDITAQRRMEQAAAERNRALEILNSALARSLDTADVVAAITGHALPMLRADGVVMHDLTGPEPRLVGLTGHGRDFISQLNQLPWENRLEPAALATGEPQFVDSPEVLARRWPQLLPLVRSGGKKAWAVIPLVTAGETVGVAVFTWDRPQRFGADARSLLGTVGVVTAQALRSAAALEQAQRRAQQARHRAERLERELGPGRLDVLPGIHTAARYHAREGVGGHWYAATSLPSGRTLAAVGSVTGSAGDALGDAMTASGLRQAVLLVARMDLPLGGMLDLLNESTRSTRLGGTGTCLLVAYDPTTGQCDIASAGQGAPVIMRPGQAPALLDVPLGRPLGAAQVPAEVTHLSLPAGTVLALPAGGTDHLADAMARYQAGAPLPADARDRGPWLERLCAAAADGADGDRALLTMAADRLPPGHIATLTLPLDPKSAGAAREFVGATLTAWDRADLVFTVELVVSELMSNTVRHTSAAGDGVRLRLLNLNTGTGASTGTVVIEVYDGSRSAPLARLADDDDEDGRGLFMISTLVERWGSRPTPTGKCIWAEVTGEEVTGDPSGPAPIADDPAAA